jgi:hypothetical protein
MLYNLMFIDVGNHRLPTYVHKMDVITGDHVKCVAMMDTFTEQIDKILSMIMKEKPDKIIFDKTHAIGQAFYTTFMREASYIPYSEYFNIDPFGLITYKDDK